MKALKAAVVGMGILLLVGFTVVIVTLINRYGGSAGDGEGAASGPASAARPSAPFAKGFGERRIAVPRGADVIETRIQGDRIVVRLRLTDGSAALLLIDAKSGEERGLVRLDAGQ